MELKMKIAVKLSIVIVATSVLGIGILLTTTLLAAKAVITQLTHENAVNIVRDNSRKIQSWLDTQMDITRTVAQIMEGYETTDPEYRRRLYDSMLRGILEKNPELTGTWTVWEPNALDGLDSEYINTPGSDRSGRYLPYFSRSNNTITLETVTDYDTDDFYQLPRRTGQESLIEPYLYNNILMTSCAVPIKKNGVLLGVVGVDIGLSNLESLITDIQAFGSTGRLALFSNTGTVSAHPDPARIGKSMEVTEASRSGPHLTGFINAVRNGTDFNFFYDGTYIFAVPLTIGKTTTPWSIAISVSQEIIMAPVKHILVLGIIIAVLMIIGMSVAAIFIARSISKPIKLIRQTLKAVGQGDLTQKLTITSNDEIGDLSNYFNKTFDRIKALIITIKAQTIALFDTGNELSSNMIETTAAINEITANIQSIKNQVISQTSSVTETNSAMEHITVNIDKLDDHVKQQALNVSQSSSAIEEMLANIQSVTQTLIKNVDNVNHLASASEVGRTGLQEVASDIQAIAHESEGLLEINAVMENIASQTNLLSMNAAIEAAHAGESGKGFAVVAGEIRKLAENSGEQSKTISIVLKKIKDSIDKITKSTNAVLNKFEAIDDGVKTVSDQEADVRNAMEEQGAGSKQILDAISLLNDITEKVKDSSVEMLEGSRGVINESNTLEKLTEEIANGMSEMASGAEQINIAVNRANDISGENKDNIEVLVREIGKFKVE
jgi:methyl-accepting chemotaxis protein